MRTDLYETLIKLSETYPERREENAIEYLEKYLLDFTATAKGAKNCSFSIVSESSPIRKGPDTDAIYSDDMYTPNGYPVYAKDLEKLVTFYSELKLKKEKNYRGEIIIISWE